MVYTSWFALTNYLAFKIASNRRFTQVCTGVFCSSIISSFSLGQDTASDPQLFKCVQLSLSDWGHGTMRPWGSAATPTVIVRRHA